MTFQLKLKFVIHTNSGETRPETLIAASRQPFPPPTTPTLTVTFIHSQGEAARKVSRSRTQCQRKEAPTAFFVVGRSRRVNEQDCAGCVFLLRRTGGEIVRVAGRQSGRSQ